MDEASACAASVNATHLGTVVFMAKTVSAMTVSVRTSAERSAEVTVSVHADAASARRDGSGSCASSPGHVT